MADRFSITLNQLTYFTACARHLNMTAASQELHVAQSAVSTAISHLEQTLGATLFVRQHSKGLVLTRAGEKLLQDSRDIFDLLTESIDAIREDQEEVRGTLRLACFTTFGPFILPTLVQRLSERHPGLAIEITEGDYAENLAALRAGQADLAINYDYTHREGLPSEVVGEARPHVLVHADHPLASRGSVALAELADDDLILLDLPGSFDYFLGVLLHAGVTPRVRYRSSNYETVRSMVAKGLGSSILNQRPLTDRTYGGDPVVVLEISDPVPTLNISLFSLGQSQRSARVRAVTEELRAVLAK